jgi:hypothetical protein
MIALFSMISQNSTRLMPARRFSRLLSTLLLASTPLAMASPAAAQPTQIHDNTDPGFGAQGSVEIIASIPDLDPSGIAVIGGRLFLSFPSMTAITPGPRWGNGAMAASSLSKRRHGQLDQRQPQ